MPQVALVRYVPDGVLRPRVAVAGCPGEQAALQAEAEQVILCPWCGDLWIGPFGDKELGQGLPGGRIVNCLNTAGAVKGVLVVLARKRVQRIPAVPVEIGLLGPGHDKRVQATVMDHRAHRVHPRPAVAADRCQERQSHPELLQQHPARFGEVRLTLLQLTLGDNHGPQSAQDRIPRQRAAGVSWPSYLAAPGRATARCGYMHLPRRGRWRWPGASQAAATSAAANLSICCAGARACPCRQIRRWPGRRMCRCLVGCLVLPHDVGADPATLGDLQASCPGPGPHRAAIGS